MIIVKRNGSNQEYKIEKIIQAVRKAFISTKDENYNNEILLEIAKGVEKKLLDSEEVTVEHIQDLVEEELMSKGYYQVAKNYILYRQDRNKQRTYKNLIIEPFIVKDDLDKTLTKIQKDFNNETYSLEFLNQKFNSFLKDNLNDDDLINLLIKAACELITKDSPKWGYIAGRILFLQFNRTIGSMGRQFNSFYEKVKYLSEQGLYGDYILKNYSKQEINEAETFMDNSRNELLDYSGLELLLRRYVIRDYDNTPIETVQEMYLGIALHLAMLEKNNRMKFVKEFYDMLSSLKVTMATPTLANSRKPISQMSSCFIDTVPDTLDGIYRSIDNFAKVSKLGGGMGLYFGKVRAKGGSIRGFKGAAGGVIRWIRLVNDTAVAVDQLGVRAGACAVYLDVWHKDLPEFLQIRTNNGDDRLKAHDIFPAVCYPDYFWEQVKTNLNGDWYLMDPHEISTIKNYNLEDSYGEEWTNKYLDCVRDNRISKRVIPLKELVRLIIKCAVETGTPFAFYRDAVNRMNPNKHKGMIYSSNLCTEIAQNMSEIKFESQEVINVDNESIVVTKTKPGDFVVCNLASLTLGRINVNDKNELHNITKLVVRALDNVIDLNTFPLPYAKVNNENYRPIGLGVSGYHHMLAKNNIKWESEEHLRFVDDIFERINFAAIEASNELAIEKGKYNFFDGSDWDNGDYFKLRDYTDEKWTELKDKVHKFGIRNAYLLAIAPTASTSIISGTTPGIDPIMDRYFLEEKKTGLIPRVAPDLDSKTYWLYKNAYLLDQSYSIRAGGIRQRHIDQAVSMNLYITNDYTFRQILNLYILAYEKGLKSIYYIRSKSLEIEACESCSA